MDRLEDKVKRISITKKHVDNLPIPAAVVIGKYFVYSNGLFFDLLGIPPGSGRQLELASILDREDLERFAVQLANQQLKISDEYIVKCFDGTSKAVRATSASRTYERKKAHFVVFDDISDYVQRAKELYEAYKNAELVMSGVAHELRDPFHALSLIAGILLDKYGHDEKNAMHIRSALALIRQGSDTIRNILEIGKANNKYLNFESTDLSEAMLGLEREIRLQYPEYSFEFEVEGNLMVYGHPGTIRILLRNLLVNAVKFTSGVPQARIEFGFDAAKGEYYVRDNGVGFPPAHAHLMFDRYTRLHDPKKYRGHGIGLDLARRIVGEIHGGTIRAESQGPGTGATLYFRLQDKPSE